LKRDLRAAVVADDHQALVERVDPEVVRVAVRNGDLGEGHTAVDRAVQGSIECVDDVLLLRIGHDVRVVPGTLAELVLAVRAGPCRPAVVGAVHASCRLRLDDRPDAVRIRW